MLPQQVARQLKGCCIEVKGLLPGKPFCQAGASALQAAQRQVCTTASCTLHKLTDTGRLRQQQVLRSSSRMRG